jgi:tRNA-Thr(GGU) m(6)t(6)A37 methyltransferase TsaA
VGVFASRSPTRPNPIGLSVVRIKRIEGNVIHVSGLDVFDGTPLLDIKPYIDELDVKKDANLGWVGDMDDPEHLALHIQGVPHDF